MPLYEYRCRACGATHDALRGVAQADAPVACTCGESDTVRLPSLIARVGGDELPMAGAAGGCCGAGGCGCGH